MRPFYTFVLSWTGVLVLLTLVADGVGRIGIYQGSRLSALAEIAVVTTVVGVIALGFLRTVFRKLTDGPLY